MARLDAKQSAPAIPKEAPAVAADDGDTDDVEVKPEPKKAKPAEPVEAEETLDADTQKRLAVVARAEKRQKEEIARMREELRSEADAMRRKLEGEWGPRIESARRLESIREKRRDADAVAELLGLEPDDLEPLSQALYLRSPKAKANPEHRAQADRALRDREYSTELGRLRKELDEIKKVRDDERASAETERQVQTYLDSIVKRIGDESPLVQKLYTKDPSKTRERLRKVAATLYQSMAEEFGERADAPKPADVIKALEAKRLAKEAKRTAKQTAREKAIFEKYGLDPAGLKAKEPKATGEKKQPTTNGAPKRDSKSARDSLLDSWPD